jgi:hypothetical protein
MEDGESRMIVRISMGYLTDKFWVPGGVTKSQLKLQRLLLPYSGCIV